jgi:ATP/maltotriose-dependent transcriptional regulator MalT
MRVKAHRLPLIVWRGELAQAADASDDLARIVEAEACAHFSIECQNGFALVRLMCARYREAGEVLQRAMERAELLGYRSFEPHLMDTKAQLLMVAARWDEALTLLRAAADHPSLRYDLPNRALVLNHAATAYRRFGQFAKASCLAEHAIEMAGETSSLYARNTCKINAAYARGLIGDTGQLNQLMALERECVGAGLGLPANKCRLFAAILSRRAGVEPAMANLAVVARAMLDLRQWHVLACELVQHAELGRQLCLKYRQESWISALIGVVARHPGGIGLLARLVSERDNVALWAVENAHAFAEPGGAHKLLVRALRSPSPEARRAAAKYLSESGRATPALPELTQREAQVVRLMAQGYRNEEVAAQLFLSRSTVKTYVNRIFRKLGVTDRVGAVLCYRERVGESANGDSSRLD